jgi:hypothetical protein
LTEAPPEPPNSGWSVFVGQMTIKLRHDEPDVRHDQSKGKLHILLEENSEGKKKEKNVPWLV